MGQHPQDQAGARWGGDGGTASPSRAPLESSPPGKRLGWGAPYSGEGGVQLYCPSWPFSDWQAGGQGREGGQTQGQRSRREGGVKGERGLSAPLAPSPLQMTGPRRSGSGWSGPASSLPSFPAGRQNYSPGTAFFFFLNFLKPDQRWDPAGHSSKISAMRSLGFSRGTRSSGSHCP